VNCTRGGVVAATRRTHLERISRALEGNTDPLCDGGMRKQKLRRLRKIFRDRGK
jgi:hypothetical protein